MFKKMDRRGFLKALPFLPKATIEEIKETQKNEEDILLIRPPYSDRNSDWSLCIKCEGICIKNCDEKILFRHTDGSPYISFNEKGCTFCKRCAESCEFGVLTTEKLEKINVSVKINKKNCLSWNGTMCFSCKEPCLDNAIKFEGIFKPEIVADMCSGCGFCIPVCPTKAIQLIPSEVEDVS